MLLGSREENAGTKRIPDAVLSLFPWAQRSEQENVINVERKVGYPGIATTREIEDTFEKEPSARYQDRTLAK